jgi:hypothetical protein
MKPNNQEWDPDVESFDDWNAPKDVKELGELLWRIELQRCWRSRGRTVRQALDCGAARRPR